MGPHTRVQIPAAAHVKMCKYVLVRVRNAGGYYRIVFPCTSPYMRVRKGSRGPMLIRGIRMTFLPYATLITREFPIDWGDHALKSPIKGLYISNFEAPSPAQHANAKASAPLREWADWPHTRHNIAGAHAPPLAANTRLACGFQASSTLSSPPTIYGALAALLPSVHHAPHHNVDTQPQIPGIIRALLSILIDCYIMTSCQPASPSMLPSIE
jgi:hypothetical protein